MSLKAKTMWFYGPGVATPLMAYPDEAREQVNVLRFRTQYEPFDREVTVIEGESLTQQSAREECDVNCILERYQRTGNLGDLMKTNPEYGDFSAAVDYQTALHTVMHAQEQFAALPSKVRERFGNEPVSFLEYLETNPDPKELAELGVLSPEALQRLQDAQDADAAKAAAREQEAKRKVSKKKADET